jgi:predicted transcriptional regulator
MEDIKEVLKSIGLGKNETEVYIDLVKRGLSSVLEISKETKIHRSNVYEALDNLLEKGLIYIVTKEKKKFFYARPANSLLDYLKNKEIEVGGVIERLNSEHSKPNGESCVSISKGQFALREALMSLLDIGAPISLFGIPQNAIEVIGPLNNIFHKERIARKIPMRHIYNKGNISNEVDRIKALNQMPYTEAKHLPSKYDSMAETIICGNKVILIVWHKDITVIEILNEDVSRAYQNYFEILWKSAKTF